MEEIIGKHALLGRGTKSKLAMFTVAALLLVMPSTFLITDSSQAVAKLDLGTADTFAILAGAGITNAGHTSVLGNIGSHPTETITGQTLITQTGEIHMGDSASAQAKGDLQAAYAAAGAVMDTTSISGDLTLTTVNSTLNPGAYDSVGAVTLTGNLILDANWDANAVFLLRINGALAVAAGGNVTVINGGSADNVYWRVNGATSLAANSKFLGTVLAQTTIAVAEGASIRGRLLAMAGSVTLSRNNVHSYNAPAVVPDIVPVIALDTSSINLASADSYAVFAGGALTNAGEARVIGDIGALGAVTAIDSLALSGQVHVADEAARNARTDLEFAQKAAKAEFTVTYPISGDLIGRTLTAGVYETAGALALSGPLVLDAQGNPDAVFLIRSGGALNIDAAGTVVVVNLGNIGNVYWDVTGAATIGAGAAFAGTLMASGAITVGAGATVMGRVLSTDGAITLSSNNVTRVASSFEIASAARAAQVLEDQRLAAASAAAKAASDSLAAAAAELEVAALRAAAELAAAREAAALATAAKATADADAATLAKAAKATADADAAALAAAAKATADADAATLAKAAKATADAKAALAAAAETSQALKQAVAIEAAEVRIYGAKSIMAFAVTPSLIEIAITRVNENVELQIAAVPEGPVSGGDASLAARY